MCDAAVGVVQSSLCCLPLEGTNFFIFLSYISNGLIMAYNIMLHITWFGYEDVM